MPLTDIKIKSLKPEEKPYKVSDQYGLFIYVTPAGSKKWRLKYRFNKKENVYFIGDYPAVSLRDARAKTFEIKEMIAQGIPLLKEKNIPPLLGVHLKMLLLNGLNTKKIKKKQSK